MNENSIGNWKTIVDKPANGDSLGRIDQYELIRELGGGGFGTVFLARDTESEVDVAVKGLPPFVKFNREEMENIRSNFRLVHDLHHPHIAAALYLHPAKSVSYASNDVGMKLRVSSGDTLLVMAYAPGVTLSQWRKQFPENKVPLEKAIEITRQIADALDYAHERKVVHRDVKPANVMIETDADGKVTARVLDFGLAAEIRSSMGRVSQEIHDTSGTRPYMAPEQWLGGKQGPATDQYSLAVLFHELVTGAVPFESVFQTGDPVVMMNVVGREAPKLPSDLPKSARIALARALAKTPEERFSSCLEFVKAIEGKVKVKSPSDGKSQFSKITAILLAVLCIGGGVWYWQDNNDRRLLSESSRTKNKASTSIRDLTNLENSVSNDVKTLDLAPAPSSAPVLSNPENVQLKQECYGLKATCRDKWEHNKKEEWHKWPKFNEHAATLDSAWKTAEIAFNDKDYGIAKEHYFKVQEEWVWLNSNKVVMSDAIKAKDQAYQIKVKFKQVETLVSKYALDDWASATNDLYNAEKLLLLGEYYDAHLAFCRSTNNFEVCRMNVMKGVERAAETAYQEKKSSERKHVENLRTYISSCLSEGNGAEALKNAAELMKVSHNPQDGVLWMKAWLKTHANDATEVQRKQKTIFYLKNLTDKYCTMKEKDLCTLDFSDAKVMRALGFCFDTYETVLIALAFFNKAKEMGCTIDVDKKISELNARATMKRYFDSIETGDLMEIREIVTLENPRKDIMTSAGVTLMHMAAQYGNGKILDYMESVGYTYDVKDKSGITPFFYACMNTNAVNAVSSIKWFLKRGSDVNAFVAGDNVAPCPIMWVRTWEGYDVLMKNGVKTDVRSKEGKTPIHHWVSAGNTNEKLLYKTFDKLNVIERDLIGKSPLHYAVKPSFVQILVSHGADINAKDNEGKTPLHWAYANEVVNAFIKCGADVNAKDNDGKTPLHEAYSKEIANTLIQCGADVNAKDNEGRTPLACRSEIEDMAILIAAGANVNEKNGNGEPLLLKWKYNYPITDFLLSKGADCNLKLQNGNMVFHEYFPCYQGIGDKRIIELLLRHIDKINAKNKDGNTVLHETYDPEVALMIYRRGANPNVCNNEGKPPLLVMNLHPKVAEVLIKCGADPNLKLERGGTVFTEGFSTYNSEAKEWTKLCVINGADINALNWQGYPLVVDKASTTCFKDLKFLVEECGADVNAVSKDGQSALCKASFGFNDSEFDIVKYLVEHGADLFYKYKKRTALEWASKTHDIEEYLKDKMGIWHYRNGDVKTIVLPGGAKMEMIYCEPGSFQMGNKEDRWGGNARPHRVTLTNGFWLGKYEVMQSQWKSVMGNNPSEFKKWLFGSSTNYPVENVDWYDCQEFIKKVNEELSCGARLPTEAEWEYACRAGTDTNYSWGNEPGKDRANYGDSTTQCRISGGTVAVGRYKPNSWGFYDMHGNVGEWCNDWHDSYPLRSKNRINPMGPDKGDQRVVRGGNWFNDAKYCCSWFRAREVPSISCSGINGFRLLCARIPEE